MVDQHMERRNIDTRRQNESKKADNDEQIVSVEKEGRQNFYMPFLCCDV